MLGRHQLMVSNETMNCVVKDGACFCCQSSLNVILRCERPAVGAAFIVMEACAMPALTEGCQPSGATPQHPASLLLLLLLMRADATIRLKSLIAARRIARWRSCKKNPLAVRTRRCWCFFFADGDDDAWLRHHWLRCRVCSALLIDAVGRSLTDANWTAQR